MITNEFFSYHKLFFMSIIGTIVEHNRAGYWALEHSIMGKKKKHNLHVPTTHNFDELLLPHTQHHRLVNWFIQQPPIKII